VRSGAWWPRPDIPGEAVARADIWAGQIPYRDLREALSLAAPLIVAAELDHAAEAMEASEDYACDFADQLRRRASELRGEA
jgi:hypothetical protein